VVIGDDLLGGSFVFDPFELHAEGVVSNVNMKWGLHPQTSLVANLREHPLTCGDRGGLALTRA
jgi:hypothetical protein